MSRTISSITWVVACTAVSATLGGGRRRGKGVAGEVEGEVGQRGGGWRDIRGGVLGTGLTEPNLDTTRAQGRRAGRLFRGAGVEHTLTSFKTLKEPGDAHKHVYAYYLISADVCLCVKQAAS